MERLVCHIKEYIQPFERKLALQELHALVEGPIVPLDGDIHSASTFSISQINDVGVLRSALTYWKSVGSGPDGITAQLRGEASVQIARDPEERNGASNGIDHQLSITPPNRRLLRYATHGIHEYRGKFFPQLVRALMNIAKLPENAVVADPMCGSGTTLVEACLAGRNTYGLDMNPLSVFITSVKCQALSLEPTALRQAYSALEKAIHTLSSREGDGHRLSRLSVHDQNYLEQWFSPQVLTELARVEAAIGTLPLSFLRDFFLVSLSNILRKVSWQKEGDLRVRREHKEIVLSAIADLFLEEASRSTRTVAAFLEVCGSTGMGSFAVDEGDARQATKLLPALRGQVDTIITSPPYATALPYIDTDRLSLIYLGLLPHDRHRARDIQMIGNREVTPTHRQSLWHYYQQHRTTLPKPVYTLIDRIEQLNKVGPAGFRRKNLPSLLSKYFFDMREVLSESCQLLRQGSSMFLVVGSNRTVAGNQPIEIDTPSLLTQIATSIGFKMRADIPMEMLVSRTMFRRNAVPSERILHMERL